MGQRSEVPARDINFREGPKINMAQLLLKYDDIEWHDDIGLVGKSTRTHRFSHFPVKKRGVPVNCRPFSPIHCSSSHAMVIARQPRHIGSQACRRFQPSKERVVDHLSWGMAKCAWHCWFLHQRVKRSVILMGNLCIWNLENLVLLYLLFIGFWCKACNWCYSIDYPQYIPSTFCICPSPVI